MDESAQQAVSIGVNLTIFVIALTISLTLMFSVRDMAKIATEVDSGVPDGALQLSTENVDDRIISGYELIAYYYNYIVPYYQSADDKNEYNHPNVGVVIQAKDTVFKKEIIDGNNQNLEKENDNFSFNEFKNKVDLNAKYLLNIKNHYDNTGTISGTTVIYIEQIPEMAKGEIYSYYVSTVKENFINSETNELFDNSKLNIVCGDNSYFVNVNEDSNDDNSRVREIIDGLEANQKYSVRIKRNNPTINMKTSSIILYIDKVI